MYIKFCMNLVMSLDHDREIKWPSQGNCLRISSPQCIFHRVFMKATLLKDTFLSVDFSEPIFLSSRQCNQIHLLWKRLWESLVFALYTIYFLYYFDKAGAILEEETSIRKILPPEWPVGKPLVYILDGWLMWMGPSHRGWCQPWVGSPGWDKKADRASE